MAQSRPMTRYLGQAERALQALLQRQLQPAGISFPEWGVLTFLRGAGSLDSARLSEAIERGRLVAAGSAGVLLEAMSARGLIERSGAGFVITDAGKKIDEPLRTRVTAITADLERGLSEDDLAATRRTLRALSERAEILLADANSVT